MTHTDRPELSLLAKLVTGAAITLIVAGLLWHGIAFARFGHDLVDRTKEPMKLRLILQPSMAAIYGIHAGLKAVRIGVAPYLTISMLRNPQKHVGRLRAGLNVGLNETAQLIVVCLVIDAIYQILVLKTFYPFEALIVALLLAFVPYMIIRGVVVRVWLGRASTQPTLDTLDKGAGKSDALGGGVGSR